MRLGFLTTLAGLMVLAVALIGGCSSDDRSISAPPVVYGSNDDPEFVPVKAQIDSVLGDVVGDVFDGLDELGTAPGEPENARADLSPSRDNPIDTDPDTLIVVYLNDWYFVYACHRGPVYYALRRDSLQYQIDGTPVEIPNSNVDLIHVIDNWTFTAVNQNVSHVDYAGRNEFVISDLDQLTAQITGTANHNIAADYIGTDTSLTACFSFNATVTNLAVTKVGDTWSSGCPSSGGVAMTLAYVFSWSNGTSIGNGSSTWEVTATFDDGEATVTASNGETTWQYQCQVCLMPQGTN